MENQNYFKILKNLGYKNVEYVRTFDGKKLFVTFRNERIEKEINI